jgi:hypothetical protein
VKSSPLKGKEKGKEGSKKLLKEREGYEKECGSAK